MARASRPRHTICQINASPQTLLSEKDIGNTLRRLAFEILEHHANTQRLVFIGLRTRGVTVAERVRDLLKDEIGEIPLGTLDIGFFRDDLHHRRTNPEVKSSELPFAVDEAQIVLFDDVLYTGRSIRAAIEAIFSYGRPARVELAVLIDRGNHELPIRANYVGHDHPTAREDYVRVRFKPQDDDETITFFPGGRDT